MEVGLELKAEMEAGVAGPTCCLACVRSRVVIADAVVWQHLFWGRLSMVDAPLHWEKKKKSNAIEAAQRSCQEQSIHYNFRWNILN